MDEFDEDDFLAYDSEAETTKWQRMLANPHPTEYLVATALITEDPCTYVEILETLQLRATPEVFEAARALCESNSPRERQFGASILSRFGDVAPPLRVARRLRMSGEEDLCRHAEEYERPFGPEISETRTMPKEALAILLPMLERETDNETLRDVLCAIAEYQDFHPSITEHIAALRHHPDPHVRFTVSTRLSLNIEHPAAWQALTEMANEDEHESVRAAAREWLKMGRILSRYEADDELPSLDAQ